jgi:putative ABC transport system permease protein
MIRNYLKIAFRNLVKNKVFSAINILGLSAGLATCLLIMLYIFDENGYDKHHSGADRIFRVAASVKSDKWAAQPGPLAAALKEDFPEVEESTRMLRFPGVEKMLLTYQKDKRKVSFFESNGFYIDASFFNVFSYDFIHGDGRSVLREPNSLVISEKMALKLFGKENPLDKVVKLGLPFGEFTYTVKGVFRDNGSKSHIPANFFISMKNSDIGSLIDSWKNWTTNSIFYTYVKLKQGADALAFDKKLDPFLERRAGKSMKEAGFSKHLFIQPVTDIYLHSDVEYEVAPNGNISYLYIFGSIAAFLLIIACINFMNLSTARSEKRAREVGVRKAMGAGKQSLIAQFLGESMLMCLISIGIALLLVQALIPPFNNLTGKNLSVFSEPSLLFWLGGLSVLTGILSGLYPAFYLSSFRPVEVLKGKIINGFAAVFVRKGLVIFQFTVSVVLILGALIIWKQLNYLKSQPLGFEASRRIVIPLTSESAAGNYTAFKNALLSQKAVESVTAGSTYPGIENIEDMLFYPEGSSPLNKTDVNLSTVDDDYIQNMGFKVVSGRSFSREFTADSVGIVLNESAVKALGFTPAAAIGKKINYELNNRKSTLQVVGVIKDFHFQSLHQSIKPLGFVTSSFGNKYAYAIATINTDDYAGIISSIEKSWKEVNADLPFGYSFMDQDFQKNYEKDQLTSQIVIYFTLIAILIACLGLYGLAAFSAEQRTKEIGIRKVLGASTGSITRLLSKDFIKLVLIANIIAFPLAWYAMSQWLKNFSYKIDMSVWFFVLSGLIAISVALLTVGHQSLKAALMNPVKSLKSE